MNRFFCAVLCFGTVACSVDAQLAITEIMSSASTNLGPDTVVQGPDFWELTNFGSEPVDLTGYVFNDGDATRGGDANATTLSGIIMAPGESIVLVQSGTTLVTSREEFLNWWGATNLPVNLQVLFYSGNGMSSGGDSIVLWAPDAASDADSLDRASFGEAARGHSFTYNPTNGAFGIVSSNGVGVAFKAVTSDDQGSPGSTAGPVQLKIIQHPTPATQNIPAGYDATFSAAATGLPRGRFQWRLNGTNIPGAIQPSLTISNVQAGDAGQYSVVVFNGLSTLTSSNAILNVTTNPVPPTFTLAPADLDAFVGQAVQLTAQANGSPTPSFQWKLNGTNLPGETAPQLLIPDIQTNQSGTYTLAAFSSAGSNGVSVAVTVGERPKLMITEVHSTGSAAHQDWWELTSFDNRTINLKGWRWDDNSHSLAPNNAYVFTNDLTIRPGESIVFVENLTPEQFRAWWGTPLPPGLQIVRYAGGGLGLSSGSDEVNLWNAATVVGNELSERVAAVNFASLDVGKTFVYDPENPPVAGIMGVFSMDTIAGTNANGVFTAEQGGDVGSPGRVTAPTIAAIRKLTADSVELTWPAVANRQYAVEFRDSMEGSQWVWKETVAAAAETSSTMDVLSSTNRFYRVGVLIPFVLQQP